VRQEPYLPNFSTKVVINLGKNKKTRKKISISSQANISFLNFIFNRKYVIQEFRVYLHEKLLLKND